MAIYAPEIVRGPPMPGAPWARRFWLERDGVSLQFNQARKKLAEQIASVPDETDRRASYFTQRVAGLLNSLLRSGYIIKVGLNDYQVLSGALTAPRPPTNNDDVTQGAVAGCFWIDTIALVPYVCVSATISFAVWYKLTPGPGYTGVS